MRRWFAGLAVATLLVGSAAAAEFGDRYDVQGTSPGGGDRYTGTVTIKQTGPAVYQVVWVIAGEKFVGAGIGSPEGLAVGYKSGSNTGTAIYSEGKGGVLDGYWTYAGGKQVGEEKWTPR